MNNYDEICANAINDAQSVASGASKSFIKYRQEFNTAVMKAKSLYKKLNDRNYDPNNNINEFANANATLLSISHRFNGAEVKSSGITKEEAMILSVDGTRAANIARAGMAILK